MNDYITANQRLYRISRKDTGFQMVGMFAMGLTFGMALLATVKKCDKLPEPVTAQTGCRECHYPTTHAKMTEYFKSAGSPVPAKMATAVLMTPRPRLMAAVAAVESGGNPNIRRGGWKGKYSGSFQVDSALHGKVSPDPIKQAAQAEKLLSELIAEHGLQRGLSRYGGDSTDKYCRKVLAELTERVP